MAKPQLTSVKNQKIDFKLAPELLLKIHDLMVKTRALEERLIKMNKQNDGFFWIGGPGEEAFNIPMGLLLSKGKGPKYDFFHGHYRSAGVQVAMGVEPIDFIRQMKNTASDPFSRGRNFCGHSTCSRWNVAPITSPIETQFSIAPGTAIANKRHGKGVTVVVGGDAGTAEGDFATSLVWSSRPANPLPMLMIVTNNKWGISTPASGQHGDLKISERGRAFGIRVENINGNDPEESYLKIKELLDWIRVERKPVLLEARVSRLYGHSSATGCNYVTEEDDPVKLFEAKLEAGGLLSRKQIETIWDRYNEEFLKQAQAVRSEPQPAPESMWDSVFHKQTGKTGKYGGE